MFNKRRYTSDIAVFDMFTVILPKTFNFFQDHESTTPLVEATVNETLWYFFPLASSVISPC